MKNRIIASLLICLMMLSSVVSAGEVSSNGQFSGGYMEKYSPMFITLGIMEKGEYDEAEYITRAQFIKSAIRLYGEGKASFMSIEKELAFTDISKSSPYYPYIKAAAVMGLISEAEAFRPNDNIELSEALKILVSLLGYAPLAEVKGGYPLGYTAAAFSVGVSKGIDKSGIYVTPNTLARLLINTLTADDADYASFYRDSFEVGVNTGISLMERSFDVFKGKGIVDADFCTTLLAESNLDCGQVRINGAVYEAAKSGADSLLGNYVEYYYIYDKETEKSEIIFAVPSEPENRSIFIDTDNVNVSGCTAESFSYYVNGNLRTARISVSASYILNNVLSARGEINFGADTGSVELIDNNGDGLYDVVKVLNYDTMVISGVSEYSKTITGKNGKAVDLGKEEDYNYIEKQGADISFDELQIGDVVSYYESNIGDCYVRRLYVSSEIVNGQIERIFNDYVVIDGAEYKYISEVKNDLKMGVALNYYIDYFGKIVDVDNIDDEYVYGFLKGIENDGIHPCLVRIFTENNRFVTLELRNKVKNNGTLKTADEFYGEITPDYQQLVRYKVNGNAEVIEIDTATDTERWSSAEKAAIDGNVFRRSLIMQNDKYRGGTKSMGGQIYFGNAPVFFVPEDTKNEDGYEVISVGSYFDYDETIKKVEAYDMDLIGTPGACVITSGKEIKKSYSDLFVTEELCRAMNRDGQITYALSGMFRKYDVNLKTMEDDVVTEAINSGDIVTLSFNGFGEIISISKKFDITNGTEQKFLINSEYDKTGYVAGKVLEVDFEQKRAAVDYGTSICIYDLSAAENVYIYDVDDEKTSVGSLADIIQNGYIFARVNYLRLMEIVVFE